MNLTPAQFYPPLLLSGLLALGCSSGAEEEDGFTVELGPVDLEPGQERILCVVKSLGNQEAIRVGTISSSVDDKVHHFAAYYVDGFEERTEPYDCTPFEGGLDPTRERVLTLTQLEEETRQLPPGVAYTLEPQQMVRLEMHVVNAGSEVQPVSGSVTVHSMPDEEFEHEAAFLYFFNMDITVPPRSDYSTVPAYLQLPAELSGVNFVSMTGHTHQWGVAVDVDAVAGPDDTGAPLYPVDDYTWSEPAIVPYDPPFQVPDGGGLRLGCHYRNTGDETIYAGNTTQDEMCAFWTYYYPSQGTRVCVSSDRIGLHECCPGSWVCDSFGGDGG